MVKTGLRLGTQGKVIGSIPTTIQNKINPLRASQGSKGLSDLVPDDGTYQQP